MSRAPLNVSREMKLLLLLLLMVALIGLWYVWTGNRNAEQAATTPVTNGPAQAGTPNTSQTNNPNVPSAPGLGEGSTQTNGQNGAAGTPPITVQPEGPVEVEVIPPFPASSASGEQPSAPPTPDGINPQGELAGVPSSNPFQPLSVEREGGTTSTPSVGNANTPADQGSAPTNSGTYGNALGQNGGVLPITPVPGTPAAGSSVGGLPSIPGGNGASSIDAAAPTSPATVPSTTITPPATAGQNTGAPQSGGTQSGGTQNSGGQSSPARNPTAQTPTPQGSVTPLPTDQRPFAPDRAGKMATERARRPPRTAPPPRPGRPLPA